MRIIAGNLKGRRLDSPKSCGTRPTTDRVREAIFSVLNSLVHFGQGKVLDLFSGTGALGFEAISRGAASCVFVENDRVAAEAIRATGEKFGVSSRLHVIVGDVQKVVSKPSSVLLAHGPFDLVFADPPYDLTLMRGLAELLGESKVIRNGSVFVLECSRKTDLRLLMGNEAGVELVKEKTYGETKVVFYYFRLGEQR